MSTRVLLDDQIFSTQRRGGVSRYYAELLRALRAAPELGVEVDTPFRHVLNEHLIEVDPTRWRRPPERLARGRLLHAYNARRYRDAYADDVVHHTFYFPRNLHLPARARVCTVYDMVPELLPELIPPAGRSLNAGKEQFVRACDAVLCISATTRDDLMRVYGDLDKPVVVTPLGVGPQFAVAAPPGTGARPYALLVGERGGYKNADLVYRALQRVPGLELVLAGGQPLGPAERERLAELDLEGRVRRLVVPDADLPGLYAGALCLVFPSRYEGFGLPLVEAFAAGCPVVAADTPCLVEVGGEAAAYVGPDDDEALAEALEQLRGDRGARDARVAAGRLRARDFTWRRTAELTAEVYRSLS